MTRYVFTICAVALALVPYSASAHVGGGDAGFVRGFFHPLGRVDHIFAMIAVGLFAAHLGGRALWLVPLTFLATMATAGLLGIAGVCLPFVEIGIGMSVLVLGPTIAFQLYLPTLAAMGLVGFFAIFHGHAHGAEMVRSVSGLTFGFGILCATALLHAVGIGLGTAVNHTAQEYSRRIIQVSGGAMAIARIGILGGVF
jgi:urease accessory protein